MGWEDTQAPCFAAEPATEGRRAELGGTHLAEKNSAGPTKTGIAQTSAAEVAENEGETD